MLFFRFKKAPAGTLLLRNAIFRFKKAPADMLLFRNVIFYVQKSPCGVCFSSKNDEKVTFGRRYFLKVVFFWTDDN